ncbi:MAG: VWA domain-containing protein [Armatimonadota bacterium]|nr:VWA domain-containing protein [Armatimonadota bacterium]MDR7561930.1 VWA domain-containing protein [Armatimonadota bacterium]MDR7568968.1 VWA domain-containing protein [Armatimonadota bacterium]MDR7601841.1 VWA domain-containing protein [Armatimonadota bacterium]
MRFLWPEVLWGLLLVPLGGAWYLRAVRARSAHATAHSSFPYLLLAPGPRWRAHLPAGLYLLALSTAILALARPQLPWPAPAHWPVVLILDVSRSMEETDIRPTRIEAAKRAAQDFVRALPGTVQVAVVTFGNYASVVVPLTADRRRLLEGITGITTQLRTQLGNGLVEGVRAVAPEGNVLPSSGAPQAVAILLSDGRASDGIPPLEAARFARERGVRVYTVGIATRADASQLRSGYWGVLDEETLRAIAAQTGGRYYHTTSARELRAAYRDLARTVGWTHRPEEVTGLGTMLAALLLLAATILHARQTPLEGMGGVRWDFPVTPRPRRPGATGP